MRKKKIIKYLRVEFEPGRSHIEIYVDKTHHAIVLTTNAWRWCRIITAYSIYRHLNDVDNDLLVFENRQSLTVIEC